MAQRQEQFAEVRLAGGVFPVDVQQKTAYARHVDNQQKGSLPVMASEKTDVLQGTLDLIVLRTLESMGPLHGYGISQRLGQLSERALQLNQGTLYPALLRLEQRGWIASEWGRSESNRRARFYSITPAGRKQLRVETESWERMAGIIARLLQPVD